MPRANSGSSGWQGASLVAITYVYFLIFAQFAFLKRLASLGVADAHLKAVMAAMAGGGILFSLLAPRISLWPSANLRLRIALCASGAAAFLSLLPLGFAAAVAVSFLIGAGLGLLTVTLATHLRQLDRQSQPAPRRRPGDGRQAILSAIFRASLPPRLKCRHCRRAFCAWQELGSLFCLRPRRLKRVASVLNRRSPFYRVLAGFTALVWLDSAAFFIIQNTPALKAGTWQGTFHLWANGLLHLAAALTSAWFLRRRGLSLVLTAAFLALAMACLLLLHPDRALLASVFYPIGVSLYSVALVAYPSLLAPAASARGAGPNGRMDLRDCRLDGLCDGHRHGPESRPCAPCLCRRCRRGCPAASTYYGLSPAHS